MRVLLIMTVFFAAVPTGGCGPGDPLWPLPEDDGRRWHAGRIGSAGPGWGLSGREFIPIEMPEMRSAQADRVEAGRRFVFNLTADGDVVFRGATYAIHEEGGAPALTREVASQPRPRPGRAMLHADRTVAWRSFDALVRALVEGDTGLSGRLQIGATNWFRHQAPNQRVDVQVVVGGVVPDGALEIELGMAKAHTNFRWEGVSALFPRWTERGNPDVWSAYVDEANDVWDEVEDLLPAQPATSSAVLRIWHQTPLDYVMTVIDILMERGVNEFFMPPWRDWLGEGDGPFLRLAVEPRQDSEPRQDAPSSAAALRWVAFGAVLAAVIPLLGLVALRRR